VNPELRDDHEAREALPREDAEIANADPTARQRQVQQAIESVERPEDQALEATTTLGEHDRRLRLAMVPLDEEEQILRAVFTVGIHDDRGVTGYVLVDIGQANRDRPLMPEVPPQPEHPCPGDLVRRCVNRQRAGLS
jgi:hypothetical protein